MYIYWNQGIALTESDWGALNSHLGAGGTDLRARASDPRGLFVMDTHHHQLAVRTWEQDRPEYKTDPEYRPMLRDGNCGPPYATQPISLPPPPPSPATTGEGIGEPCTQPRTPAAAPASYCKLLSTRRGQILV